MTTRAIEVSHVWKRFQRGETHDSLRDLLPAIARRLRGGGRQPAMLRPGAFWALQDVDFRVAPGEALGIIGPNGAGKSTLLKLVTKILKPTSGECRVRGRVGALIEVSAGFHQDLTGRENIFLQGAIMGMPRREIAQKIDQIIDFAGVADFLDTPVKRYSSGMQARLGFSVAAHLDPDVLVIDEVLAVGDMAFQEKCIARLKEYKRRGVAVMFVSHNMQAVSELCDRALYLRSATRASGTAQEAIGAYLHDIAEGRATQTDGGVQIVASRLVDELGRPVSVSEPGAALELQLDLRARERIGQFHMVLILDRSTDGLTVYHANVDSTELGVDGLEPGDEFTARFRFRAHITRGQYHFSFWFEDKSYRPLAQLTPAALLTVNESRTWRGVADLELECSVTEPAMPDADGRRGPSHVEPILQR
jgi:lipopolysaccharide transport system ATP-binding protein